MKFLLSLLFASVISVQAGFEAEVSQLNSTGSASVISSLPLPPYGTVGVVFYEPGETPNSTVSLMGILAPDLQLHEGTHRELGLSVFFYNFLEGNFLRKYDAALVTDDLQSQINANQYASFSGAYVDLSGKPDLSLYATNDDLDAIELTPGPKGDTGSAGPKGDSGDVGPTGPSGASGSVGPKGDKGDKGDTGSQGSQGIQGVKGDTGSTGPAGTNGTNGSNASISLTTTGSGAASYNTGTGALNVPTPSIPAQVAITGSNGITASGTYPNINLAHTKRQETYSGTTNASGLYTVAFGTAYSVAPNIQVNTISGNNKETQITTVSTTGFTVYVQLRSDVLGLLPTYGNVSGRAVDVLVTEK